MAVKYLKDLELKDKTAVIRVDYNVPYDESMNITDDIRIRSTLPTINYCIEQGAKMVLISHMGRPKGKRVPELSLKPVAERLSKLFNAEIRFSELPPGPELKKEIDEMGKGEILLMENIRFFPEEENNDDEFGKAIASLGDVYIDDAFATAHRANASNAAAAKYFDQRAAGFLMQNEIEYFRKAMLEPEQPITAIIGGVKIESKIKALKNLVTIVDNLLIGGAMAYTFLKAQGHPVGHSIVQDDYIPTAKEILEMAEEHDVTLLLPIDHVVSTSYKENHTIKTVSRDKIPSDMEGVDIGPETVKVFRSLISGSRTIIWNGPMGVFEMPEFAVGTNEIAKAIGESKGMSVIGGGDSDSAVHKIGYEDKIDYISTGGGAFLELLEGKKLPAIAALEI